MSDTAEQKLNRILYLLPAAAQPQGAALAAVAEAMGIDPRRVGRDAIEASDRAYYMPAGVACDADLALDGDRVHLSNPGSFRRPIRLVAREAAALGLGLRSLAMEAAPERRSVILALTALVEAAVSLQGAPSARDRAVAAHGDRPPGEVLDTLRGALAARRAVRIEYLKPDQAEPETRVIETWGLLFAERWWYAVAHCRDRAAPRLFRVDRILDAEALDEGYDLPNDFDPAAYAPDGRAFVAADAVETRVRYAPRIAGWVRERFPEAEGDPAGGVVVRHRIADPTWLVRHVVQYGRDAEVVGPPEMRRVVRDALLRRLPAASAG